MERSLPVFYFYDTNNPAMSNIIFQPDVNHRQIWASARAVMEADNYKRKRSGKKSKSRWTLFTRFLKLIEIFLRLTGIYSKGYENVKKVQINKVELDFDNLPESFDNYKILHLSDLHIDSFPGIENIIAEKINGLKYDLCVITGDFRLHTYGSIHHIINPLKKLLSQIQAPDGIWAILGNHDSFQLVEYEKELNIHFLVNESVEIKRGNDKIVITGTDDPFRFFNDMALTALDRQNGTFKIALVHTTELNDYASRNGYKLYLCGHTHGGQICLPGGIPIITHQFEGKKFYKGLWHLNGMTGYTSSGCGVSGLPLRFNCPGEIVLITLRKKN